MPKQRTEAPLVCRRSCIRRLCPLHKHHLFLLTTAQPEEQKQKANKTESTLSEIRVVLVLCHPCTGKACPLYVGHLAHRVKCRALPFCTGLFGLCTLQVAMIQRNSERGQAAKHQRFCHRYWKTPGFLLLSMCLEVTKNTSMATWHHRL